MSDSSCSVEPEEPFPCCSPSSPSEDRGSCSRRSCCGSCRNVFWNGRSLRRNQMTCCPSYTRCSALMTMTTEPKRARDANARSASTWHDGVSCSEYQSRHPRGRGQDAALKSLAQRRLCRECTRCKRVIELAAGCYHISYLRVRPRSLVISLLRLRGDKLYHCASCCSDEQASS